MKRAARIAGIVLSTLIVLSPLVLRSDDDISFVIPAGTTLDVQLTSTISTKSNQTGDLFTGKTNEPIIYHGEEVVPESSMVEGHITFIQPAGRVKGKAELRLVLDTIKIPSGQKYAIKASLKDANAQGVTIKDDEGTVQGPGKSIKSAAKEAGIAAGGGAAVGAMVHGGEGAMYGAAAGLVAAVVHTMAKHHGAAVLPAGTDVTFLIPTEVTATKTNTEPGVLVVPGAH